MAKNGNSKQQLATDPVVVTSPGGLQADAQLLTRQYQNLLAWVEGLQGIDSHDQLLGSIGDYLSHSCDVAACRLYVFLTADAALAQCFDDKPLPADDSAPLVCDISQDATLSQAARQQGAVVSGADPAVGENRIVLPLRLQQNLLGILCVTVRSTGAQSPLTDGGLQHLNLMAGHIAATVQRIGNNEQQRRNAAELGAARDQAEKASNAKSMFLSHMSHELRTPLNAILGFAQLLELNHPNPKQLKFIREILNAGNHLLEQINQVLDLSRIEANRMEMHLEAVSVHRMIAECCDLIRPLAEKKRLQIACDLSARFAVRADSVRLKQVMLNLLSNAVKYNRPGGRVDIKVTEEGNQALKIRVYDTGCGLSAEQCTKVFDVFERFGATANGIEGSGIGMAIAKKLVTLMDGEIGVNSTPGTGSEFWFILPKAHGESLATAAENLADAPATLENLPTLLYVEDMPANLRLVESLIATRGGFRFISAPDGQLGLEIAQTQLPDIILLDLNLPGLHGFEVIRHLRMDPLTQRIPVVAISADGTQANRQRAAQEGFYDFLTKPLDVQRFFSLLDSLLETRPARQWMSR